MICLLLLLVVVAVVIAALIRANPQSRARAVERHARLCGLYFAPEETPAIGFARLANLPLLRSFDNSYRGYNFVWGEHAGRQVMLFEYRFTCPPELAKALGRNSGGNEHACCVWPLPAPLPMVSLYARQVDEKVTGFAAAEDRPTGDAEFDAAYYVHAASPEAVQRVLTADLRNFIQCERIPFFEVEGSLALLYLRKTLTPDRLDELLRNSDIINEALVRAATELQRNG